MGQAIVLGWVPLDWAPTLNDGDDGKKVFLMSDRFGRLARPLKIVLVLIPVILLVMALTWWQDRSLAKAEALLQSGDPTGALDVLDTFLARRANHQRARLLKARTLVALEQWDGADELFSQTGAGTSAELRAWATALLHQQQWVEALRLLEQLNASDRNDAETLRDLTICRYQLGQADPALQSATQLASLPGHALEGLFHLGVIHGAMGNTHMAIESWERIEEITPDATGLAIQPAAFFRGYAEDLMLEARPRQALAYLQRSLALQSSLQTRTQLGEAWYRVGETREATKAWTDVLKEDENNQEARLGLAELALNRADAEAALQWLGPVATDQQATEAGAYMMQRAHTLLDNENLAEHWQQKVAILRKSRRLQAALEQRSNQDPR